MVFKGNPPLIPFHRLTDDASRIGSSFHRCQYRAEKHHRLFKNCLQFIFGIIDLLRREESETQDKVLVGVPLTFLTSMITLSILKAILAGFASMHPANLGKINPANLPEIIKFSTAVDGWELSNGLWDVIVWDGSSNRLMNFVVPEELAKGISDVVVRDESSNGLLDVVPGEESSIGILGVVAPEELDKRSLGLRLNRFFTRLNIDIGVQSGKHNPRRLSITSVFTHAWQRWMSKNNKTMFDLRCKCTASPSEYYFYIGTAR